MTKWHHKCNLGWLKERQKYLTATDVKELLPITKTGRVRKITDEHYLKVLASKMVYLDEDDCISTGAAARGHILEPYAIERYNEEDYGNNEWLWHWDDVIVTRPNPMLYSLAFSPDALDCKQDKHSSPSIVISNIQTIGEVKSYSPEKHLIAGHTPKQNLDERWQIATAMAVCPSISNAYLLFYNPSMYQQLYIVNYDRIELLNEIEMIIEVEKNWLEWIHNFDKLNEHYIVNGKKDEEQAIINNIMHNEILNPESEKTVIK